MKEYSKPFEFVLSSLDGAKSSRFVEIIRTPQLKDGNSYEFYFLQLQPNTEVHYLSSDCAAKTTIYSHHVDMFY